jgi:prevent-host-death family protein
MATRMGIRQLRDHLTATIRRVRAGETIEVTHDGEPVAVLSPYRRDRIEELVATGRIRPATRPLYPLPDPLPITGPMTASEALEEDRAGR